MKSKRMTRQRSFNRFYKHFVIDKNPICMTQDDGSCRYRMPRIEGEAEWEQGCAIGIQPEFQAIYNEGWESVGIPSLYETQETVRNIIREEDLEFFNQLQGLHDCDLVKEEFEVRLLPNFIEFWGLNKPPKYKHATFYIDTTQRA